MMHVLIERAALIFAGVTAMHQSSHKSRPPPRRIARANCASLIQTESVINRGALLHRRHENRERHAGHEQVSRSTRSCGMTSLVLRVKLQTLNVPTQAGGGI